MTILEQPLTREELKTRMDENGWIEEIVPVYLSDMIDSDANGFLDFLSECMTGTPLMTDIGYKAVGIYGDRVLLSVEGNLSDIVGERTVPKNESPANASYRYDCVNAEDQKELGFIIDNMETIPLHEFETNVNRKDYRELLAELGYTETNPICNDWHVNFYKCRLPEKDATAYVLVHSAIEYVFY